MKYITILEKDNEDCPNVGTISCDDIEQNFKDAIESHFDAELLSFSFVDKEVENLGDCINSVPIDVLVKLKTNIDLETYIVVLSETWLYL